MVSNNQSKHCASKPKHVHKLYLIFRTPSVWLKVRIKCYYCLRIKHKFQNICIRKFLERKYEFFGLKYVLGSEYCIVFILLMHTVCVGS